MDRDNRTRTGAKDPWGRAAPTPLAQRLAEARPGPDTEPDQHVVWKRAKGRCKPRAEAGMPGAGLTAEVFGKNRSRSKQESVPVVAAACFARNFRMPTSRSSTPTKWRTCPTSARPAKP